jgi:hypothetical protein
MAVRPDNVDDRNLHKLDGSPAVHVAATKRASPVPQALTAMAFAQAEYEAALAEENAANRAHNDALRKVTYASRKLQAMKEGYDNAVLQERKLRIDPVDGRRVAG